MLTLDPVTLADLPQGEVGELVSSGDQVMTGYWRNPEADAQAFFERDGRRYSHNIDPKTGLPVHGVKSVTVISPSAELCDALATAVFVMGPDAGLHLIGQLPDTHCLVIDAQNRMHLSKNMKIN